MNCQQFQLYAAELYASEGRKFANIEEVQAYVDTLRDTPLWQRQYPQVHRVEVFGRPVSTKSSVGAWQPERGAGVIEMLDCHMSELYVMHELGHVLASARYGSRSHDPWFARTYMELVYQGMGSAAYASLRRAFVAAEIDFEHSNSNPGGIEL
jgi:putative metallohydrolase (TIGR04338 family)